MPISRLPDATVRELGSTLAVSTPVALVQELVDNAIDAGASFVDLLISHDTLDRIEVRDNGHGIPLDDLKSLGRSGYTSKITTFEDLTTLGGKSLGFRGVALASINTVAEVSLTTRTAEEPVATLFQLSPGGGIEFASKKHTPAPVGTTVLATKLFSRTPVREKIALKQAHQNMVRMKRLLRSYVLARPSIKLQLRVVKGDNTFPWDYAPPPQASIKDAVTQLFGTRLASSCAPHTFHGIQLDRRGRTLELADEPSSRTSGAVPCSGLAFEAYLPHASADVNSIVSYGAFFSIDSRPVTFTRGTFKKIYASFQTHLSRAVALSSPGQNGKLQSPFIRLDIRCAPGSYDPNIEPSKDDVLFHDEGYIMNQFESFMLSIYPTATDKSNEPTSTLLMSTVSGGGASQSSFTIVPGPDSSTQRADCPSQPATLDHGNYPTPPNTSSETEHTRKALNEKLPEAACTTANSSSPVGQKVGNMRDSSIPSEETRRADHRQIIPRQNTIDIGGGMADPRYPLNLHLTPIPSQNLPTASPNLVGVQNRGDFQPQSFVVDMSAPINSSDDEDPMPHRSRPHTEPQRVGGRGLGDEEEEEGRGGHLEGLNPWSIAKLMAPRRPPQQPLPQTVVVDESDTEDMAPTARRQLPTARVPPRQYHAANTVGPSRGSKPPSKVPGGVYKKPTIAKVRGDGTRGRVQTTLERFRHINQPIPTIDAREEPHAPIPQTAPSDDTSLPIRLPKEDPRGYLLRGQHAIANDMSNKLRRFRTELLPLEMTPLGAETHRLRLTMNVNTFGMAELFENILELDRYCRDGKVERGLYDNMNPDIIDRLIAQAEA